MPQQAERPRIIVVGSSNTDMVVKAERLPSPGETLLGGEFVMVQGGKGANQAVAAARLGAQVTFVARLGMDVFGDEALASYEKEGIETRYIARDDEHPSGVALIMVDRLGENSIAVAPGANAHLSAKDVECAAEAISSSSALVLQLEIPLEAVVRAAAIARENGVRVILNPAPMPEGGLPESLLRNVDLLIPNETETRILLRLAPDAVIDEVAAKEFSRLGVKSAIITLGARGSLIVADGRVSLVPTPRVVPVDTTAAGDAYVGALAVGLSMDINIVEAIRYAGKAAALSVTRMGAQSSLPYAHEVAEFVGK